MIVEIFVGRSFLLIFPVNIVYFIIIVIPNNYN